MLNDAIECIDKTLEQLRTLPSVSYVVAWDKALLRLSGQRIGLLGQEVWYGTMHRAQHVAATFRTQAANARLGYFDPKTIRVLSPQEATEMLQQYRAELAGLV